MKKWPFLKVALLGVAIGAMSSALAQNFTVTPEKPQPGDVVEITYTPAGNIANTMKPVEGVYYASTSGGRVADDLTLSKKGKVYTATVKTDTSMNFIQFGFKAGKDWDTNFENGYYVLLHENGKPKKGANLSLSLFYQYYGTSTGLERSPEKALEPMKQELELHPEQKESQLGAFYRLYSQVDKEKAIASAQAEIDARTGEKLKTESDYATLEMLYAAAKQTDKLKELTETKKKKFPNGKWLISDVVRDYYNEKDVTKKEEMLASILNNIKTKKDWEPYKNSIGNYYYNMAYTYSTNKMWAKFDETVQKIDNKDLVNSVYNSVAWTLQGKSEDLDRAEKYSALATSYAKAQMDNPSDKPASLTPGEWERRSKGTYAMYADTYGMVMYRLEKYEEGLPYAQYAAIEYREGKDAEMNNTFALLAEKVLSAEECKKQLEQFVREGKATGETKGILKRQYLATGKTEQQFETYIAELERESHLKMLEELKKKMLSDATPAFAVKNLEGTALNNENLKGKVTVIDFWATWCGPCKASFPGMQRVVNKYESDPNVQFFFVDSWENGDNKQEKVEKFIESNKYTFNVLMDLDDDMINKFKVEGIPTKFVVDKEGVIRFKTIGFDGNDEKLMEEIDAMIEMAASVQGSH